MFFEGSYWDYQRRDVRIWPEKPPFTATKEEQDQRKSSTLHKESLCFISIRAIHQAVPDSVASPLEGRLTRRDSGKGNIIITTFAVISIAQSAVIHLAVD